MLDSIAIEKAERHISIRQAWTAKLEQIYVKYLYDTLILFEIAITDRLMVQNSYIFLHFLNFFWLAYFRQS
jgi:hypothetical protein